MKAVGQGSCKLGHEISRKVTLAINMFERNLPIPVGELLDVIILQRKVIWGNTYI